jgi:hypothetical protein
MQRACRDLHIPVHWDSRIVQSYIQTNRPYEMMMCSHPHLMALVADHPGQELCLLMRAYKMFGILGKTPNWQAVSGLGLALKRPSPVPRQSVFNHSPSKIAA